MTTGRRNTTVSVSDSSRNRGLDRKTTRFFNTRASRRETLHLCRSARKTPRTTSPETHRDRLDDSEKTRRPNKIPPPAPPPPAKQIQARITSSRRSSPLVFPRTRETLASPCRVSWAPGHCSQSLGEVALAFDRVSPFERLRLCPISFRLPHH